jgi:membrane protein implicated in regulation of membrane protease activity
MTQSRRSSLAEAMIGTAIGFLVSVALTAIVLPAYGHAVTLGQNVQITLIFTVASIVRSYAVRRLFNRLALMRNSQRDLGSVL